MEPTSAATTIDFIAVIQPTASPVSPEISANDSAALLCLHQKSTIALEAGLIGGFAGIIFTSILWALGLCLYTIYRNKHDKKTEQDQARKRIEAARSTDMMKSWPGSRSPRSFGTKSFESQTNKRGSEVQPRQFSYQEGASEQTLKRYPGPRRSRPSSYQESEQAQDDDLSQDYPEDDHASDI